MSNDPQANSLPSVEKATVLNHDGTRDLIIFLQIPVSRSHSFNVRSFEVVNRSEGGLTAIAMMSAIERKWDSENGRGGAARRRKCSPLLLSALKRALLCSVLLFFTPPLSSALLFSSLLCSLRFLSPCLRPNLPTTTHSRHGPLLPTLACDFERTFVGSRGQVACPVRPI